MRTYLISAFVALILLSGCEGAAVPLGSPEAALFDEAVLGSWVTVAAESDGGEGDDDDRMYLRLLRFNDAEYYAEARTDDDEPDQWMRLRIYPTVLERVMIANLQCVGCEEREWLFFSYELGEDGRLVVSAVVDEFYRDEAADIESTAELRDAASSRMAAGNLVGEPQTFVRWEEDPELD